MIAVGNELLRLQISVYEPARFRQNGLAVNDDGSVDVNTATGELTPVAKTHDTGSRPATPAVKYPGAPRLTKSGATWKRLLQVVAALPVAGNAAIAASPAAARSSSLLRIE